MRKGTKNPKYKIGQIVCLKSHEDEEMLGFVGTVLAYMASCAESAQGYGILMRDGNIWNFYEEELYPLTNILELQRRWEETTDILYSSSRDNVIRHARTFCESFLDHLETQQ